MSPAPMRLGVAACLMAAMVVGAGCSIFEPREAEAPATDTGKVAFVPANDAAGVFVNLKSGIENLDGANYERSVDERFVFLPLLEDALDLPGAFDNWTKTVEMDVMNLMLSGSKKATVTFDRSVLIDETDYVQFQVTYKLELVAKVGDAKTEYHGVAHIDVRRTGGLWLMEKWEDVSASGDYTTWGYLRGVLRQQLGG